MRDTNAVLERVMEAKLQREKRLQEDDSELGSLPSIFLVRQQSRKDSAAKDLRVHKLSLSDRGDLSSYLGSPVGSVPKIVVHDGAEVSSFALPSSLPKLCEAEGPGDHVPGAEPTPYAEEKNYPAESGGGNEKGPSRQESQEVVPRMSEDVVSADGTFADAETGTLGEGTNTERSDYFTPPTSPPDTSSPTTPDRDGGGVTTRVPLESVKNGCVQRKSDPEVGSF